jgi:threonine aldolase
MLGGGMRQAGIIAAAGIVALDTQARRLHQDHSNARLLAEELNQIDGVEVDLKLVQSNIINVDFYNTGKAIPELVMLMKENGILVNGRNNRLIRFVTHNGISACDIQEAVQRIKLICE